MEAARPRIERAARPEIQSAEDSYRQGRDAREVVTVLCEKNSRARLEVGSAAWRCLTGGVAVPQAMLVMDGKGPPHPVRQKCLHTCDLLPQFKYMLPQFLRSQCNFTGRELFLAELCTHIAPHSYFVA